MSGALSRLLVVRTCGYLERTVIVCVRSYLSSKGEPRVSRFGSSWLNTGINPRPTRLIELVERFDDTWADDLREKFSDNDSELMREISFLVDRRIRIAHGQSESVGARKALDLIPYADYLADWFLEKFDPR